MVFDAVETVKTFKIQENGSMTDLAVVMPNFTNAITGTLTIEDEDGVVLYTKAAIARNATTIVNTLSVPVDRNYIGRLTLSGAGGAGGGTVSAKIWVDTRRP
jgi:hypothetical protein